MSRIVDSGATDHITPHLYLFSTYSPVPQSCFITMPNGRQAQVLHVGTIILSKDIILQEVLHVPDFHFNILSASKIAKHLSSNVVFSRSVCYIQDPLKNKQVVLGKEKGGLYFVDTSTQLQDQTVCLQQPLGPMFLKCGTADWDTLLLSR